MKYLFLVIVTSVVNVLIGQTYNWEKEYVSVYKENSEHIILGTNAITAKAWDQLEQPLFWQKIMQLSPDSVLINVATTRKIIAKMSFADWSRQTEAEKQVFKDSVKQAHGLPFEERINVTNGKNNFYRFDLVFESLAKGVSTFEACGVDPWFAQSILLIESPGKLAKSSVGAYGAFQLMPSVARSYGLTVNSAVDERKDFYRSAFAAAQLLKKSCIPSAQAIARGAGLPLDEQAIWFRLLVMHVYHAGAGNVHAVVNRIGTVANGEELIQKMWVTSAASFGNSSQNYSQLALAAHLQLAQVIQASAEGVYPCFDNAN